jgi:hypothetical protein
VKKRDFDLMGTCLPNVSIQIWSPRCEHLVSLVAEAKTGGRKERRLEASREILLETGRLSGALLVESPTHLATFSRSQGATDS